MALSVVVRSFTYLAEKLSYSLVVVNTKGVRCRPSRSCTRTSNDQVEGISGTDRR